MTETETVPTATAAPSRWLAHLLVTLLWGLSVAVGGVVEVTGTALDVARSAHILGLVLALGSILLIDWYGLAWLSGLRHFRESLRLAEAAEPLIWFGSIVLLLSGAFLHPDLGDALAWTKLGLVLLVLHNGVAAGSLAIRLRPTRPTTLADLSKRLRTALIARVLVSQLGWWGAVVIGLITSSARTPN